MQKTIHTKQDMHRLRHDLHRKYLNYAHIIQAKRKITDQITQRNACKGEAHDDVFHKDSRKKGELASS